MTPRACLGKWALACGGLLAACSTSTSVTHQDATFGDDGPAPAIDGGHVHRPDARADAKTGDAKTGDAKADASHVPDGPRGLDATHVPDGSRVPDVSPIVDVNRGEPFTPSSDFCKLPGSVVWSAGLPMVVPGGPTGANGPDLSWLKVPDGYCTHFFATVPETRQLRFSPSGDLFVASPSTPTAGGASGGLGAILVLPDDNHDGLADTRVTYLGSLPTTQGLLFTNGSLYYQDGELVRKTPYQNGDRQGTVGTQVIDVNVYKSTSGHFQKVLDVDDSGNIYVTNGGDNSDECEGSSAAPGQTTSNPPFHGGILQIDGTPNGKLVARGLRNAIAIRCAKGTGTCFGLELALDFAPQQGSREKLFPIHQGDNWGFPCCATANQPYGGYTSPVPDCSGVAAESSTFIIDHTPFGLDFEQGLWGGTWKSRAFIVLHGEVGSWKGARVVGIGTDAHGLPLPSSEADAGSTMQDFATGWDDGTLGHGRPAAITFAPDGRMFVGNDVNGMIVWIAPVTPGS